MRLDKYLSLSGERTRSEATRLIRSGQVRVNGMPVRDGAAQVAQTDEVLLGGEAVPDSRYQYILLHKPAGVLTAARDSRASTVMELLPEAAARRKVLPVGRLDKDTTGLLLLTNDGELAHRLLSPKRHVWKTYQATVEGRLAESDKAAFAQGMELSDFTAKPARLTMIAAGDAQSQAEVEVREGKFHQVKRMFAARGHEVLALHRVSFGSLRLPDDLPQGAYRELTTDELAALRACAGGDGQTSTQAGDEQSDE